MSDDLIRALLPFYYLIYFGFAFILKTLLVARRTGQNPMVIPKDDTAFGLIGKYFRIVLIGIFLYVIANALLPSLRPYFVPVPYLQSAFVQYAGLVLLAFALTWTIIAQNHMKDSWRIGIDTENRTELITSGLFSISRNPIFFGMIISLTGLFLTSPDLITCLFLVTGSICIQVQVRLEETFLEKQHKEQYISYRNKVRRFI